MKKLLSFVLILSLLISPVVALADQDGFISILLIGEDEAAKNTAVKGASSYGRADAIIVATLDMKTGAIRLLSVDRDYLIDLPVQGQTKLCIAHFFGGPELLLDQVNALLGLEIEKYAKVDKSAMATIAGKLGGIDIDVREEDLGIKGIKKTGVQTLSKSQVIAYMAGRDTEDITSDVGRTERQRIVLMAMMDKIFNMGMEGMLVLAQSLLPVAQTNVSVSDIVSAGLVLFGQGMNAPQQDRSPRLEDRREKTVKAHFVVYVVDMEAEIERVHAFLYGA